MFARILTLFSVLHYASSFSAPLSRPAGVVVDELLPLLDEGGTTRSRNKSPETISKIDACLEELREAGRGAKVLDDPRLFGEYEIKYFDRSVDGGRDGGDDAVKPSVAKRLRKAIFFLPFKATDSDSSRRARTAFEPQTIVNYVTFRFFGVPAAVTARPNLQERRPTGAPRRALSRGTVPLSTEAARVVFDAPRVSLGGAGA